MATSSVKRGLFRTWLVFLGLTLIGAPCWHIYAGMTTVDHSCFELLDTSPSLTAVLAADFLESADSEFRSMTLPVTLCTDPLHYDEANPQTLRRAWRHIKALRVKFSDEEVKEIPTSSLHDLTDLFVRSDMVLSRAVFWELVRDTWIIEAAVLIAFTTLWWVGRLTAALILWIRRGFAAD